MILVFIKKYAKPEKPLKKEKEALTFKNAMNMAP